MKAAMDLDESKSGEGQRSVDRWAWLYPELRTLARDWLLPAAAGVVSALLVGFALATILGHEDRGAVSWHNFIAVLAGFVVAACAFGRAGRGGPRGGGDDRTPTGA